jgi:predicted dehydrogenase
MTTGQGETNMAQTTIERRDFLKRTATAGAGLLLANSCARLSPAPGGQSPNNKLNLAVIGVAGRGAENLNGVKHENIVALCDIDENNLAAAAKQFPQAKTYTDWRLCLEQKDIDAVVCSTTDHTHAFINVWAMNRGKHVYCEKPLANSVHEARVVRETYLKNQGRLATQMGTQIHATDNYRRVVELVRDGVVGQVSDVRVWCSREPKGGTYLPAAGEPPRHLHWDLWLGPSADHPYNPGYFGGCLAWNLYWDFGSGQIGDMGSHMLDLPYWALNLRFPTSCEAQGTPLNPDTCPQWLEAKLAPGPGTATATHNPDTCPQWLEAKWEHPAAAGRGPVSVYWYDGGKKPGMPTKAFDREELFKGILFKGDQGWLLADYDYRIIMLRGDMTQYQRPKTKDILPPSVGHHQEWLNACKNPTLPTLCNFDYSGALIEHNLLALVAYRTGKKLEWDAPRLKASNCPEADAFIQKTYRQGWVLNG